MPFVLEDDGLSPALQSSTVWKTCTLYCTSSYDRRTHYGLIELITESSWISRPGRIIPSSARKETIIRMSHPPCTTDVSARFITLPFLARDRKAVEVVQIILESVLLRREKDMLDTDGKRIVELPPKEVTRRIDVLVRYVLTWCSVDQDREARVLSTGAQDLRLVILGCQEGLRTSHRERPRQPQLHAHPRHAHAVRRSPMLNPLATFIESS